MLKARLKFKAPWDSILVDVARQCGLTVDQYCERAVMLITRQGLDQGEEHGSRSQESSVVDGQVSSSQAVNSTAVVIEEDTSSTEG